MMDLLVMGGLILVLTTMVGLLVVAPFIEMRANRPVHRHHDRA